MIPVTKTYLPPLSQYENLLERIWQSGQVTNNGPLTQELTESLRARLEAPNLEIVANGTLALQLAIKALGLSGEVITTPFSYVATVNAILWENCKPVFVDIEDRTFCIDAGQIEAAITGHTSAILATHIYGYPCDVENIERIARKHDLKVIYDAAHAFGVRLHGRSLLRHGDASTLSFHATKLFHTTEGGAVVCSDKQIAGHVYLMKKFGHIGEDDYFDAGINANMSEIHAAMGLCVLPRANEIIASRRVASEYYDNGLKGLGLIRPQACNGLEYNYAYYPVVFPSHDDMMRVRQSLRDNGVGPRRYFHPSLNRLPYLRPELQRPCPVSESIASRVLCLPLYFGLKQDESEMICKVIAGEMK